jgi:hypothetical protein
VPSVFLIEKVRARVPSLENLPVFASKLIFVPQGRLLKTAKLTAKFAFIL